MGGDDTMTGFVALGCGRTGRMHAGVLARHPKADLVTVYDVMPAASAETARQLGVRHRGDCCHH